MKITIDLLEKYDAGARGLKFIRENYPNGVEIDEILKRDDIPLDFLHFGRQYFDITEQELQLYNQVCNIENSKNIWYSDHIKNSVGLMHSHNVNDSSFVRDSSNIHNSQHIYNSMDIFNCIDVAHSNQIKNSKAVLESHEVTESYDIARSNTISWSSVILNSFYLEDCSFIYKSDNLCDCHFCGFMKNSQHCLFCTNLENKEYYIFNYPVTPAIYEKYHDELFLQLQAENTNMINIFQHKHTAEERFKLSLRFDSIFNGLSSTFYGWIGTLPNYSDDVFINLFFRNREI